jgi:hypothetical protein
MSLFECLLFKLWMLLSTLEKNIKALRAYEKEIYFKITVKTFPGTWRNHKQRLEWK